MTQWGLDTLFNPAKRHMDEEKRRLQTTREQIGDSSGGRRVDLEAGKVTIQRQSDGAEDGETDAGAGGNVAAKAPEPIDPNSPRGRALARRARLKHPQG
jgi:hypothetical protein